MSDRPRGSGGRPGLRRDTVMQAGFLVGAAVGAAATVLGRRAERSARRGLIDFAISIGSVPAATDCLLPSGRVISMVLIGKFQRTRLAIGECCHGGPGRGIM